MVQFFSNKPSFWSEIRASRTLVIGTMTLITTSISIVAIALILLSDITFSTHSLFLVDGYETGNNRPIIGILSQEISYSLNNKYPGQYDSYIAASYVKFVEGAGARVLPIWIGKNESYYEDVMSQINGVLWPGGSTFFNQSNGYADAGDTIYKIAKRFNDQGDYFPILGVCLGFELLTYVAANRVEHRINCYSKNQPLPLEFKADFQNSKMFEDAPSDVIKILEGKNVTANYHQYCVTEEGLATVGITDQFHVLSSNHDLNGVEFISSLEHTSYPFYGIQFHPEKNSYEWAVGKKIPHGRKATAVSQYFADFFVDEARRNKHKFKSADEEASSLIYNYPVTYTGLKKSAFLQCYLFKEDNSTVASLQQDSLEQYEIDLDGR